MPGRWTNKFSFSGVAVRTRAIIYCTATHDTLCAQRHDFASFLVWQAGKWAAADAEWRCVSVAVCSTPREQMCAVAEDGRALFMGGGDRHEESVRGRDSLPKGRGTLRHVRAIKGQIYIAGMDRQVYRRDGENSYAAMDQGARPPAGDKSVVGFESLDGFDPREIYAAGWKGEIWGFSGATWVPLASPTTQILTDVCCAGDDHVYICGRQGTLLQGRGREWQPIAVESTKEDLWSLAWFKGCLYAASLRAVYRLEKGRLVPVEFGADTPKTCYKLSAADGVMCSAGAKDLMLFDGRTWTRLD
jgi:hypothetical protein